MTCETIQNRVLQLPDPARVPADVRAHAADCPACAGVLAAVAVLDDAIPRLPVPPPSPRVKAAFLARIAEPAAPKRPERWFDAVRKEHLAGLAAGLLLAVGAWTLTGSRTAPAVAAGPRHELLGSEVNHLVRLAKATGPAERVTVWADVTGDLGNEVRQVYLYAPDEDIKALGAMFDSAVNKGLVAQAAQLRDRADIAVTERHKLLTAADARLTATATEADELLKQAPPQAKPVLERIAKTARDGSAKLQRLAAGGEV
jgi:hypothetical protein